MRISNIIKFEYIMIIISLFLIIYSELEASKIKKIKNPKNIIKETVKLYLIYIFGYIGLIIFPVMLAITYGMGY